MSVRLRTPRTVLVALATGLATAGCADGVPTAPAIRATPNADIVLGPGLPCTECPNPNAGKIVFMRNTVYRQSGNFELYKADADGSNQVRLTQTSDQEEEPVWSPDYTRIAFVRRAPGGSASDLWVMNADGSNAQRVTNTANVDEMQPSWTPDGKSLLFISNHKTSATYKGHWQLSIARVDGTQYATFFPHLPGSGIVETCARTGPCFPLGNPQSVSHPHMAPNGRDVTYVTWNPVAGRHGVRVLDLYDQTQKRWVYGTEAVLPAPGGAAVPSHPRFSPDGSLISFVVGSYDALIVSALDGAVQQTFNTQKILSYLSWSPDGQSLLSHNGTDANLLRFTRSNGLVLPVFGSAGGRTPNWSR
jgi:Tol biopolymer transport system component